MYDQILANINHRMRNPKPGDKVSYSDLQRFKRNIESSMGGFFGVFRDQPKQETSDADNGVSND